MKFRIIYETAAVERRKVDSAADLDFQSVVGDI